MYDKERIHTLPKSFSLFDIHTDIILIHVRSFIPPILRTQTHPVRIVVAIASHEILIAPTTRM